MNNWRDMFDDKTAGGGEAPKGSDRDDTLPPMPDPADYKPFYVQRGPGRPAMFLDLRRFDPRGGNLVGTMMSYPQLISIDYFDDRTIDLNFGLRNIRIEGSGLDELIRRLQTGSVLVIQQFSDRIWNTRPATGPIVDNIVDMGLATGG